MDMQLLGKQAKEASIVLGTLSTAKKNQVILSIADALEQNINVILEANKLDLEKAVAKGIGEAMLDRLTLNE